jgi:hypothetical protein
MSKYNTHKGIIIQWEYKKITIVLSTSSIGEKTSWLNDSSLIYYLKSVMEITHLV